jgi:hypothetical protein
MYENTNNIINIPKTVSQLNLYFQWIINTSIINECNVMRILFDSLIV